MSEETSLSASCGRLFYRCCGGDSGDYVRDVETRRRVAFSSRFRLLLTSLQVQLGARAPRGASHPRDQIFDCVLHLYAHQDVDEVIKRLYLLHELAPSASAFYAPQLENFLIHGELERKECLEVFLLDHAERSIHFAHRLWFFLNAWAQDCAYTSELSSAVDAGLVAPSRGSPLMRAIVVQGAVAAARFAHQVPMPEQRRQLQHAPGASAVLASSYGSSAAAEGAHRPPSGVPGGVVGVEPAVVHSTATTTEAGRATTILERRAAGGEVRTASAASSAASVAAPPRISPSLAAALDSDSMAAFFRIRANLAAAATADASAAQAVAWDGSTAGEGHRVGSAASTGVGPTAVRLLLAGEGSEEGGAAQGNERSVYGARTDVDVQTGLSALRGVRGGGGGCGGSGSGGPVMVALRSPPAVKNVGPLMPAGGAASSLAFGGGGLAAFRETIDLMAEFERISVLMATLPVPSRNGALRASLAAVARKSLPSRVLYMPLGNVHNRLVAIHADHSFCFKTAKRAPFMVVLEVVDYANASGRGLDEDTTGDEEDARERARKRREGRGYAEQRTRRAMRRARMEELRMRAGQIHGPGGAAAAGEAAVRLVAEGVRDAADRMGEVGRELGEKMQEKASALRSYVLRKVDQMTVEPGGGTGEEASTGGRRGRVVGSAVGAAGGSPEVEDSSTLGGEVEGGSRPAGGVVIRGSGHAVGASSTRSGRGAGVGATDTVSARRAHEAVSEGAYAAFGVESEGEDEEGDLGSGGGGGHSVGGRGAGGPRGGMRIDVRGGASALLAPQIMSAPPAVGGASGGGADSRFPSRSAAGGARGKGARSGNAAGRVRATSIHSDGSVLDDVDAHKLIASEEARLRLQRVVRKLRKKKSSKQPQQRRGTGVLGPPAAPRQGRAGGVGRGDDGEEEGGDEAEVDGLLSAAAVLGRDLTSRFKPAHAAHVEGTAGAGSDADAEQHALARAAAAAADRDDVYVGVGEGEEDSDAVARARTAATTVGRMVKQGAEAVLSPPPLSIRSPPGRVAAGGREGGYVDLPSRSPSHPETTRSGGAHEEGGKGLGGQGRASAVAELEMTPQGEGEAARSTAAPPLSAAKRTEMLNKMGQWASAPTDGPGAGRALPSLRALAPSGRAPTDEGVREGRGRRVQGAGAGAGTGRLSAASGGLLASPSPLTPPTLASDEEGGGSCTDSGVQGEGVASVARPLHREVLVSDAELERETAEGLPDFDEVRDELDPDAPGEAAPGGRVSAPPAPSASADDDALRALSEDEGGDITTASAQAAGGVGGAGEPREVSVVFPERWREKEAALATTSPYSHLPGWRLLPVIVKAGDDLRQEQFVSQLLSAFASIWRDARVPVWVKPYDILATSPTAGIITAVPDTISLDALKRGDPSFTTLDDWFTRHFHAGPRGEERARVARMNFARSLAGYSIVCYILQVKDRHNGNILIDRRGHLVHIDWGFLLTSSPGGNLGFEHSAFKLTQEWCAVLGGPRSPLFMTFRKLCVRAFLAVRKHKQRVILLVQMMLTGNAHLPAFVQGPRAVMAGLRTRFAEAASERECVSLVHSLVDASMDSWRTRWYDAYQRWAQDIMA